MKYLDEISQIPSICRIVYGHDKNYKPNDHCYWTQISLDLFGWMENDDHFKQRIKDRMEENP